MFQGQVSLYCWVCSPPLPLPWPGLVSVTPPLVSLSDLMVLGFPGVVQSETLWHLSYTHPLSGSIWSCWQTCLIPRLKFLTCVGRGGEAPSKTLKLSPIPVTKFSNKSSEKISSVSSQWGSSSQLNLSSSGFLHLVQVIFHQFSWLSSVFSNSFLPSCTRFLSSRLSRLINWLLLKLCIKLGCCFLSSCLLAVVIPSVKSISIVFCRQTVKPLFLLSIVKQFSINFLHTHFP